MPGSKMAKRPLPASLAAYIATSALRSTSPTSLVPGQATAIPTLARTGMVAPGSSRHHPAQQYGGHPGLSSQGGPLQSAVLTRDRSYWQPEVVRRRTKRAEGEPGHKDVAVGIGLEQRVQPCGARLVVEGVTDDGHGGEVVQVEVVPVDLLARLALAAGLTEKHGERRPPAEVGRGAPPVR